MFSWDRLTGDVCEMSRDVLELCLAFEDGASAEAVIREASLRHSEVEIRKFCDVLLERSILEEESVDPFERLGSRRPYVPRLAVFERIGEDAMVYGRSTAIRLDGGARLLSAADGRRTLAELLPRARWPGLLRLCEADFAALKLLPPGSGVPRWADSTMPWPEVTARGLLDGDAPHDPGDLHRYHAAIDDPAAQFEETETTLSHLFRDPHPSLGGQTFGARLASGLLARGVPSSGARIVEVGGGLGWVGRALSDALTPRSYLVIDRSPSLARAQRERGLLSILGDATHLPIATGAVDLLISNEMAGDLGTDGDTNHGALALVDECARVLAPNGLAYISEFGHPTQAPRRSDHLDHDEYSLRFEDLRSRAATQGLEAELLLLPRLIALDGQRLALVTTRASFAALRALFAAHGAVLSKRAWLIDELRALATLAGIDLDAIHGISAAPIGERTMGLRPAEFWAILLRRAA